jgi:hypothetical protein
MAMAVTPETILRERGTGRATAKREAIERAVDVAET